MDTSPPTPDPADHQGPSDYEGWDPTPDPVGEVDMPDAVGSGRETGSGPGIAFIPGDPATAAGAPDANRAPAEDARVEDDEVTALRQKLAFYESFDTLIRDNIDRAGALLREVATKQVDAEAKLRTSTREFEQRQITERTGYRKMFGSMLDEISTIQQQVERLARQVSDALDDLELQLPAVGELSAIERGQAPGMTGLAASPAPTGLPSGASSAAWVTHDDDLPAATGKHATAPAAQAEAEPAAGDAAFDTDDEAPAVPTVLEEDGLGLVEDAAGEIDPEVVEDVLTEFTDADPAVADPAEELSTGAALPSDLSTLPEEYGLDNPAALGAAGVVDGPYIEQVAASEDDAYPDRRDIDPLDGHLTSAAESEGFYVDSAPEIDEIVLADIDETVLGDAMGAAIEETPLQASAPVTVSEHDGGLDEEPAVDDATGPGEVADATASEVPTASDEPAPYGSDAPLETGMGSDGIASAPVGSGVSTGLGDPPTKLRRFEPEAPRPTWGSVAPASRIEPPRVAASMAGEQAGATAARDTIVLVHGVPRATTALSLKRYLEGLDAVSAVEPREYAEGVLRLQVTGDRAIRIADLSAWPDGSGLQEIEVREDLVEIRLPG